jgi:hypothetical protein
MSYSIFGTLPLWGTFIVIMLVNYAAIMAGFRLGIRTSGGRDALSVPPINSVVGAMLALLAFILALALNSSANRYETRGELLLEDANAISTTYLRADFLNKPDSENAKLLLRRYLDLRAQVYDKPDRIKETLSQTANLQHQLWLIAISYPKENSSPMLTSKFADALHKMFGIHAKRVAYGTQYHLPAPIWITLFGIGILSLGALGFQFGISGGKRYQVSFLLGICFSCVLTLIHDIDRPLQGLVVVSQEPLVSLRASMN